MDDSKNINNGCGEETRQHLLQKKEGKETSFEVLLKNKASPKLSQKV